MAKKRGRGMGQPMSHWREVGLSYPCLACNAGPGEPCITSNQNVSYEFHVSRTNLASKNGWEFPENARQPPHTS